MSETKSKSGKSTYDPETRTWTWTTKKGKVVSRSDEDYQKRIKSLQVARLKRRLEGPKKKDEPTSSKKVKVEEVPREEKKAKKDDVPLYIRKMMKEIKQLKSVPKEQKKDVDSVDGADDSDVLVLDRKNKEHAKILAQPGLEEVTDPAEHGHREHVLTHHTLRCR